MNGKCRHLRWRSLQKTVLGFIAILLLGGVLSTLPFALHQDDDKPVAITMTGLKVQKGALGVRPSLNRQPVGQDHAVLLVPSESIGAGLRAAGTFEISEVNDVMRM